MKNGIICIETEWEHTVAQNRMSLHTKALLDFLENHGDAKLSIAELLQKVNCNTI